jgi:glycine dehydrogenase
MQRDLSVSDPFAARHIGPSSDDQRAMLATLGYETLDDLIKAALPAEIPDGSHAAQSLAKLPPARTETQALANLRRLAARNTVRISMIGLGYYATNTPAVIRRNVLEVGSGTGTVARWF